MALSKIKTGSIEDTIDLTANDGTFNGNITATTGIGVIQVTSTQVTATGSFTTASTSYVTDSTMPTLNITPSSASSKIMIIFRIGMQHDASRQIENTIYRNSTTDLSNGNTYGLSFSGGAQPGWFNNTITWVDAPTTVGEVRYTWYSRAESPVDITPVHPGTTWSAILMELP